jgi:hypothetical protein
MLKILANNAGFLRVCIVDPLVDLEALGLNFGDNLLDSLIIHLKITTIQHLIDQGLDHLLPLRSLLDLELLPNLLHNPLIIDINIDSRIYFAIIVIDSLHSLLPVSLLSSNVRLFSGLDVTFPFNLNFLVFVRLTAGLRTLHR